MLDFVAEIQERNGKNGLVPIQEMRAPLDKWCAQQRVGTRVFMRVLEVAFRRKDEHHALYRLRNYVLAPCLDMSTEALHEHIFKHLHFGEWKVMRPEREVVNKETGEIIVEPEIRVFDRRSQKTLSTQEMNAAFLYQDELAAFYNEGRQPNEFCDLPKGKPRMVQSEP